MAELIADMVHRTAAEMVRIEWILVERLIGAFVEETGRFPHVVTDDHRWWCEGFNYHAPTADDVAHCKTRAAEYHAETDIPASKALLVREFDRAAFSWRWEERR